MKLKQLKTRMSQSERCRAARKYKDQAIENLCDDEKSAIRYLESEVAADIEYAKYYRGLGRMDKEGYDGIVKPAREERDRLDYLQTRPTDRQFEIRARRLDLAVRNTARGI